MCFGISRCYGSDNNITNSKNISTFNRYSLEDSEDSYHLGEFDQSSFLSAHKLLYHLTHREQKTTVKDNLIVFKGEDLIKAYTKRSGEFLELSTNPHILQSYSSEQDNTIEMDTLSTEDTIEEGTEGVDIVGGDDAYTEAQRDQQTSSLQLIESKTLDPLSIHKETPEDEESKKRKDLFKKEQKKEKQRSKRFKDKLERITQSMTEDLMKEDTDYRRGDITSDVPDIKDSLSFSSKTISTENGSTDDAFSKPALDIKTKFTNLMMGSTNTGAVKKDVSYKSYSTHKTGKPTKNRERHLHRFFLCNFKY